MEIPKGVILLGDENWNFQGGQRKSASVTTDLNKAINRSVREGGYWEKGFFTVPIGTSVERVQLLGHKYVEKFVAYLEGPLFARKEGLSIGQTYKVKSVFGPTLDKGPIPVPSDRRKYLILAFISCRPFEPVYDIPDEFVPEMMKQGLRLKE